MVRRSAAGSGRASAVTVGSGDVSPVPENRKHSSRGRNRSSALLEAATVEPVRGSFGGRPSRDAEIGRTHPGYHRCPTAAGTLRSPKAAVFDGTGRRVRLLICNGSERCPIWYLSRSLSRDPSVGPPLVRFAGMDDAGGRSDPWILQATGRGENRATRWPRLSGRAGRSGLSSSVSFTCRTPRTSTASVWRASTLRLGHAGFDPRSVSALRVRWISWRRAVAFDRPDRQFLASLLAAGRSAWRSIWTLPRRPARLRGYRPAAGRGPGRIAVTLQTRPSVARRPAEPAEGGGPVEGGSTSVSAAGDACSLPVGLACRTPRSGGRPARDRAAPAELPAPGPPSIRGCSTGAIWIWIPLLGVARTAGRRRPRPGGGLAAREPRAAYRWQQQRSTCRR